MHTFEIQRLKRMFIKRPLAFCCVRLEFLCLFGWLVGWLVGWFDWLIG